MKSISLLPGTREIHLAERPEPRLTDPAQVRVEILEVGICGTDREEARGGRAKAPAGFRDLVIGHEMLGRVAEVGPEVSRVKAGDLAVLTVRRGCGKCRPCQLHRSDMCRTGNYKERGIWGLDGYQTEAVVDEESYVVPVPEELRPVAVLCEPLSVAEKAIDEAVGLQRSRLPTQPTAEEWLNGRRCLVAGLGPIGLLGAMALRLRGAMVFGLDVVEPDSLKAQLLTAIDGQYVDGRRVRPDQVSDHLGEMDFIFEATGVAALAFNLLDALGTNGVYALTGIPGGDRPLQIPGADLLRCLVLKNQILLGSVNAATRHFELGIADLERAEVIWPGWTRQLLTHRYPPEAYRTAFQRPEADEIKAIVGWQS